MVEFRQIYFDYNAAARRAKNLGRQYKCATTKQWSKNTFTTRNKKIPYYGRYDKQPHVLTVAFYHSSTNKTHERTQFSSQSSFSLDHATLRCEQQDTAAKSDELPILLTIKETAGLLKFIVVCSYDIKIIGFTFYVSQSMPLQHLLCCYTLFIQISFYGSSVSIEIVCGCALLLFFTGMIHQFFKFILFD